VGEAWRGVAETALGTKVNMAGPDCYCKFGSVGGQVISHYVHKLENRQRLFSTILRNEMQS